MQAAELASGALTAIDDMLTLGARLGLPEPSDFTLRLRTKLAEGTFTTLVVGEVKMGKSSFINAMLGSEVLPRDVDVATSQIFQVRAAAEEAYRVVYDDGSAEPVGRADLARFGSQVVIDREGKPGPRGIQRIEVDYPTDFVPPGVILLDTPGLGALYAAHAQITHRFIPQADAVICILDSARPMGSREIELIREVLGITRHIFLIQSKIDQHESSAWQETLDRNTEILQQQFGDMSGLTVWPFSSANLLAAGSSTHRDALLLVSRYPSMAGGLRTFLDEVCAAPRATEALLAALRDHETGSTVLARRLRDLSQEGEQEAKAHRDDLTRRWQQFTADWGEHGRQRQTLQAALRRVSALGKQGFREALQPDSPIFRGFEARIRSTETVQTANALGEKLEGEVLAAVTERWAQMCRSASQQYAKLLEPFVQEAAQLVVGSGVPDTGDLPVTRFAAQEDPLYDRLRATYSHAMPVWSVAGIALGIVATPAIAAVAGGGLLWALLGGWKRAGGAKAKGAQAELQRYLREVVHEMQRHFFSVDPANGRFSVVDEYFILMEDHLGQVIDTMVTQRVAETRKEFALLEAQAQLRTEERARIVAGLQEASAQWKAVGLQMLTLADDPRGRSHLAAIKVGPDTGLGTAERRD